ncbi:GNAT family N-acetyltransferase [Vibrio aphrogenes]|uniref:GNAT family N-acetyltransferase n=1 Tax=Vibrio aphrogenes TaxID=1891186 RepID=UPI000B35A010|nr:GNAT family N-acetyltransferase [Vibrio aphrogenes]
MHTKVLSNLNNHMAVLVELLQDCVTSGASVGFLPPVDTQTAQDYWLSVEKDLQSTPCSRTLIGAFIEEQLVGCVQLAFTNKPNAQHRAEVEKLMVHTRHRGKGISKALLNHLEEEARVAQKHLLVLDTRVGDLAADLYRKMDFTEVGQIPDFALSASGQLDGTIYFYKML